MDPRVSEDRVPSYKKVEEKIREIDNTIIIARIYYIFNHLSSTYRFQLIKKNKMCIVEIPKKLLDNLKKDSNSALEQELGDILNLYVQRSECWAEFEK
ncbi:MAG: hypothetical protein Q8N09_01880 [Thermodesulfovibrionia bacterium]|nr:hypothetical protein [Thermodesulfovibrionia bacterium]